MKRIVLIALFFHTTNAEAKLENWQFGLIIAPFIAYHHGVIHETAHVVASEMQGIKVTGFYPYPHTYDGRFYMNRYKLESGDPKFYTRFRSFKKTCEYINNPRQTWHVMAPAILDFAIFAFSDYILSKNVIQNRFGKTAIYVAGILAPLIDYSMNFIFTLDAAQNRKRLGKSHIFIDIVSIVSVVYGVSRAVKHGRNIFGRHSNM
jgi:hypothetical protein